MNCRWQTGKSISTSATAIFSATNFQIRKFHPFYLFQWVWWLAFVFRFTPRSLAHGRRQEMRVAAAAEDVGVLLIDSYPRPFIFIPKYNLDSRKIPGIVSCFFSEYISKTAARQYLYKNGVAQCLYFFKERIIFTSFPLCVLNNLKDIFSFRHLNVLFFFQPQKKNVGCCNILLEKGRRSNICSFRFCKLPKTNRKFFSPRIDNLTSSAPSAVSLPTHYLFYLSKRLMDILFWVKSWIIHRHAKASEIQFRKLIPIDTS